MSEWTTIRLGSIVRTNSTSYSPKEGWKYVNYLDTGNITGNVIDAIQHIDLENEKLPSRAKRKVKMNSILYSTVRPNQKHFGIIKSMPKNFLVSTGFAVIDVIPEKADADYLYFWLTQNTIVEQLHAIAEQSVSAYPSIKASDVENLEIALPPLSVQKSIASILKSISDKMSHNSNINENLEQQAQAYFQELFIENADPYWKSGTISDLGTVVGGSTPSKSKPEYYCENGIAWITPKDLSVNKSKFVSRGENDITELGLKNSSASIMPEGTVLFSSRAPIGYIAIAKGEVTTNQGFKSVVPRPEIGTAFVYFFLKQNLPVIEGMASGSTFKEVSGSTMKNIPATVPDADTISKFNDFCTPIFAQQRILEEQNQSLTELRNSLLPKLMAGEIDLTEIQF